ncbi:DUF3800 domain-containing protein [Staphylococcus haemolyticus]|uniref:DUF3800 domain-containing protein n=1 Tax=Staphylococcus haemolyticus TaxID=1283 RepID=UPI0011A463FA|nr:DUF3800 domain-containing protein [Staphylococcus haemolyticus]MCH4502075.1 DUF3800 domain-containing protein [Staphylococcus haemolyticus]
MNITVYSDESGVFDKNNEKYFVFGGLIFLNKNIKEIENRKYIHAERTIRKNSTYKDLELKATTLTNKDKGKLFRSLNNCIKFGVIIDIEKINNDIFYHKKNKQRYLDYAFKIGLKRALEHLINDGKINPKEVENLNLFCDEHTTATNGLYELREGLEQEFKCGTFNSNFNKFFPPLFKNINSVDLNFCDSNKKPLIRAADIVANKIYFHSNTNSVNKLRPKVIITKLP